MERLPYIDDHVKTIPASRERVWGALLTVMRGQLGRKMPKPVAVVWGLQQRTRTGDWSAGVSVGDTIPGFEVGEVDQQRVLSLRGRHRFSRYELRFELSERAPGHVEIHAKTFAEFPGPHGRMYRALVIGTGGHRIAVRRILSSISRHAAGDARSQ